jgi:hypothetical protein
VHDSIARRSDFDRPTGCLRHDLPVLLASRELSFQAHSEAVAVLSFHGLADLWTLEKQWLGDHAGRQRRF